MNKLRELIHETLSGIIPTYHRVAPDDVALGYSVYSLNQVNTYFGRNDYYLYISVICSNDVEVIDVSDAVINLLNFNTLNTDDLTYTFYLERNDLNEETDKGISRRELRFQVIGYERRQ